MFDIIVCFMQSKSKNGIGRKHTKCIGYVLKAREMGNLFLPQNM